LSIYRWGEEVVLLLQAILLIELVHQIDINKNEYDKNIDGALLGKPKT
jgi:hypothetical protein